MASVAEVVSLPIRTAQSSMRAVVNWSREEVDDWGCDPELVERTRLLASLRWGVRLGGEEHLGPWVRTAARRRRRPEGALIVVSSRRFALSPILTALILGEALDRPVRFVGRPDIAPMGALLQRLGGLLCHVDELTNVLAAGEVVVVGAAPTLSPRQVGVVDHCVVGAAVAAGAPAFPAAVASSAFQRTARVQIGPPIPTHRNRRGPLAELELADDLGAAIQVLLDEFTWNGWLVS